MKKINTNVKNLYGRFLNDTTLMHLIDVVIYSENSIKRMAGASLKNQPAMNEVISDLKKIIPSSYFSDTKFHNFLGLCIEDSLLYFYPHKTITVQTNEYVECEGLKIKSAVFEIK